MFVTPNRLTLGRPDEIIDPYHYVEFDAGELRGAVPALGSAGRGARAVRLARATWSCSTRSARKLDRLLGLDPLRLRRARPERVAPPALRRRCCAATADADDPRAAAITPDDFELRERRLRRRARPVRDLRRAATHRRCAALWCGARLDRWRGPPAAAGRAARVRRRDHRSVAERRRSSQRPTATGTGPRRAAASASSATRCCAARAARSPGGSTRSRRPARVLDVGAGDGVLLDALGRHGREAIGLERSSRRPDSATSRSTRSTAEWAAVVFWHSLEHLPDAGRGGPAGRPAAARRAAWSSSPCPNTDSLQARVFGDRWLHLDPPRHLVHLTGARAASPGLERAGLRGRAACRSVRGGQIVIGWLDGLVGSLPGDLHLYQALRRPEARSTPLSGRAARRPRSAAGVLLLPRRARRRRASRSRCGAPGTVYVEARRA